MSPAVSTVAITPTKDLSTLSKEAKRTLNRLRPLAMRPRHRMPGRSASSARLRRYEALSTRLEFKPVQLVCAELRNYFAEEGIELYNIDAVDKWLTMKAEWIAAEKKIKKLLWHWRPLRERDIVEYSWGFDQYWAMHGFYCGTTLKDFHRDEFRACQPYEKLVPGFALERAIKIEERFGDDVTFFVSDYAVVDPDPFIMVRPRRRGDGPISRQMCIFGFWDEPGFGQEPITLEALPSPAVL